VIRSVLIANRGEIARRIIRTARRLGVRTIAVYSEADTDAAHVREADASVLIGPAPARASYLVGARILDAARDEGAEAIHPGYGFLSENADFAEAVVEHGLVWVGAPPAAIRAMGLKDAAKRLMAAAGVPVTPGYLGEDQSPDRLAAEAARIGWPVLIKAVAGGGGKGMRKVERAEDFLASLASARREASSSFGDDRVLLETFVARPRHLEVQIFADSAGRVVHLFERDCSLQRRHQKVIEEAPAPGLDEETRSALCAAAVRAAEAVAYQGAGTVEFIADASEGLRADRIWFMEMNTRLQVEHPVTEAITGLDLVEWQLRVASGEALPLTQGEITRRGWAMEARLCAEDPANSFLPSTGILEAFILPPELRCDSAFDGAGVVTPYYDPMLAKLIAHGDTREAAAALLAKGCAEVRVAGIKTNAWFLARCLDDPQFVAGQVDTGFIEAGRDRLTASPTPSLQAKATAVLAQSVEAWTPGPDPWEAALFGFRLNAEPAAPLTVYQNDAKIDASVTADGGALAVTLEGQTFTSAPAESLKAADGGWWVFEKGAAFLFQTSAASAVQAGGDGDGAVLSPMPGKVVSVVVRLGDVVARNAPLVTLEAMKMEHALKAPFDGAVVELTVQEGDQVPEGAVLVRLEARP
jgi:propionyl-CoA carboxylase alpha chain/3-methylcrotonyl-CoA carboxylase alpha subunit